MIRSIKKTIKNIIISVLSAGMMAGSLLSFPLTAHAEESGVDYSDVYQFPESYQGKLKELKTAHPNWTFVPMNTGLNWGSAIGSERGNKSLIQNTFSPYHRAGEYDNRWSYASDAAIAYYMDPRNSLTEKYIFQFQDLHNYHDDITASDIDNFLNKTFMKSSSKAPGTDLTFTEIFTICGDHLGISPFHLASRVYQEQGVGKSPLISGSYPDYEGYYNYFNVGASGRSNQEVILSGLKYAKKQNWVNAYLSIMGGAELIVNKYVATGQDTVYLEKFNVNKKSAYGVYNHQYMQNICAPKSESSTMYSQYSSVSKLNNSFIFKIPVFDNMPRSACPLPSADMGKSIYSGVDYSLVYDPEYYYDHNSDVAKACGYDEAKLLEHFVNYGMQEGRQGNKSFNVEAYKQNNKDLYNAFGENNREYYIHYIFYGNFEKRECLQTIPTWYKGVDYRLVYDPEYYYENNKDVAAAFGYDEKALISHFVNYGMREGRCAKEDFNALEYRFCISNRDLDRLFGEDITAYYRHYIEFGAAEKRAVNEWDKEFDAKYYLENNPDVKNALIQMHGGNNLEGWALWHYIKYGVYEGRSASESFNILNYAVANSDVFFAYAPYDRNTDRCAQANFREIAEHYVKHGIKEGRPVRTSKIDMTKVKTTRPDVLAVFGEDNRSGWCEWAIRYELHIWPGKK